MGPKGNPPGLSFFWGCMALLAVKAKVVAEPLVCNMQSSLPRLETYRVKVQEGAQCTKPLSGVR
jgi:hypothetical protein